MESQNTRGGKRVGAGRKKTVGNVKTVSIRIPEDVANILSSQENITKYICDAIREKFFHDDSINSR